jgi:hypothetical protein
MCFVCAWVFVFLSLSSSSFRIYILLLPSSSPKKKSRSGNNRGDAKSGSRDSKSGSSSKPQSLKTRTYVVARNWIIAAYLSKGKTYLKASECVPFLCHHHHHHHHCVESEGPTATSTSTVTATATATSTATITTTTTMTPEETVVSSSRHRPKGGGAVGDLSCLSLELHPSKAVPPLDSFPLPVFFVLRYRCASVVCVCVFWGYNITGNNAPLGGGVGGGSRNMPLASHLTSDPPLVSLVGFTPSLSTGT